MNPSRISQSNIQHTGITPNDAPQKVDQQPASKLGTEARASQSQLFVSIATRPLTERQITVDNLISKDGLKVALGKASRHAKVKDAMMRAAFKLVSHKKADAAFGSLHKASLRLADKYHTLVEQKAPESERLDALRELHGTLSKMQDKHVGNQVLKGKSYDAAQEGPIKDMLAFVKHEIGRHPSEHIRVANEMMTTGYGDLKSQGASISNKLTFLNIAREHLLAAKEAAGLSDESKTLLEHIESEIDQLETHSPLKDELAEFVKNKDKNLKHVHTRVSDPVADLHSKRIQKEVIDDIEKDAELGSLFDHVLVGLDISSFDKGLLRHVDTDERTGLAHAQREFRNQSMDDAIVSLLPEDHTKSAPPIIRDPQLSDLQATSLTSESFVEMGQNLAKAIKKGDSGKIEMLAAELGQLIGGDISQCSKDVQLGFVTSRGEDLKNDLLQALTQQSDDLPEKLGDSYSKASDVVKGFLDKAYATALNQLDNRLEGDVLHLDGLEFRKAKQIGEGGFGTVSIYSATDTNGKTHQIVVKEPIISKFGDFAENHKAAFENSANESRSHRSASEGGSPHIVPFRGAVQTPDGRLLIAMDLASNGDVSNFSMRLNTALSDGTVPPNVANLVRTTLLLDMANGLRHLQESRGMTHIDIKPQNFFITGEGVTQLGDFGLADTSLTRTFDHRPLDASFNTSPDIASGSEDMLEFRSGITDAIKKIKKTIKEEVPKLPENEREAATKQLNDQIAFMRKMGNEQTFTVTEKADTFSLGMAAFGLFTGRDFVDTLIDSSFESQRLGALAEYSKSDLQGKVGGTGMTALDRVLNNMLDPDPSSRLGMTDLLSLSLFREPGVGTKEVRDLINMIADPNTDPATLKDACAKLGV